MICILCENEEAKFYIKYKNTHGGEGGYELCGECLINYVCNYKDSKAEKFYEKNEWINKYRSLNDGRKISHWGLINERRIKK